MSNCVVGLWMVRGSYGSNGKDNERCHKRALPDRMYCKEHFEEAMARVRLVQNGDKPRPWSQTPRASQIGLMHAGGPVSGTRR